MAFVIAVCYLFSVLSYGMGYSEMLVFKNAVINPLNVQDYNIPVLLATGYFVLASFFAIGGFFLFYLKNSSEQEIIDLEFGRKIDRESDAGKRTSILEVKAQLIRSEYGLDEDRTMYS
jgi:4-hydroxybenzoate polyprenyltransferase